MATTLAATTAMNSQMTSVDTVRAGVPTAGAAGMLFGIIISAAPT